MYDHNTQAHHFYLKDLDRLALRCRENNGSRRRPMAVRNMAVTVVAAWVVIGFVSFIGHIQSI